MPPTAAVDREEGHPAGQAQPAVSHNQEEDHLTGQPRPSASNAAVDWAASGQIFAPEHSA